jgi:nitrite reductase (NADH) large subunit
MRKKYVIVGSSAAGCGALMTLAQIEPNAEIICVTQDSYEPYNKCFLVDYLKDRKTHEEINLFKSDYFTAKNIVYITNMAVVSINHKNKYITFADGQMQHYDVLLLALGVQNRPIPEKIQTCTNVFATHILSDFERIKKYTESNQVKHALVIGAGLTGLETASALVDLGITVTIIEKKSHVLAHFINREESDWLINYVKKSVEIICATEVQYFEVINSKIESVRLSHQVYKKIDMVLYAHGAEPITYCATETGMLIDREIIVDNFFHTSISDIYAAGDCARITGKRASCTWPEAFMQGTYAGYAMANKPKEMRSFPKITASQFFGCSLLISGILDHMQPMVDISADSIQVMGIDDEEKIHYGMLLGVYSQNTAHIIKQAVQVKQLWQEFKKVRYES